MTQQEPFVTYLELRESTSDGEAGAGLSHSGAGLVLLHVLELAAYGEPRGAVTIVHDAGEHGGRYLDFGRELAARDWAIALPDLRGHGRSEGERGHSNGVREVIRDLGDVQDHLAYRQPDAPKVLIGHGLGAIYALAYACERPDGVAALVLAAPLFEPSFRAPQPSGGLMKLFKKVGPTSAGSIGWSSAALTSDAQAAAQRGADPLVHDVITLGAATRAREAATAYRPCLATLTMPVLLLHGSRDTIAPPESTRAPSGAAQQQHTFEGLAHDLFHGARASEVSGLVCEWLDRHVAR